MNLKLTLYRQKEKLKRSYQRSVHGYCNVLLYHRVIDLNYDPQLLCVGVDRFYRQLSELKKQHAFLTMEEFCFILQNQKKFPKNALLITFDDGYADNYINALPVLEKLNLEATFYIATKQLDEPGFFWWDELDLAFRNINTNGLDVNDLLKKHNASNRTELYTFYVNACKTAVSLEQRTVLVNEFRPFLPKDIPSADYAFLTKTQLKSLAASKNVVIGAHTVNHLSMGHISLDEARYEITESVNRLSSELGKSVEHFSYPYGEKQHFNEEVIKICREIGLKSTAANYYGYARPEDDIFSFPRVIVRNDEPPVLLNQLKKLAQ